MKMIEISPYYCSFCYEFSLNNYLRAGRGGVSNYIDNYNKNKLRRSYDFTHKTFINGDKITQNIYALTSNSVLDDREDKLIFYGSDSRTLAHNDVYSYTLSPNGISITEKGKKEGKKKKKRRKKKGKEEGKKG